MARPRIVIVGAAFPGCHAARTLSRLSRGRADIALVNPMDYFLYLPLLPEVATAVPDPPRVAVSVSEILARPSAHPSAKPTASTSTPGEWGGSTPRAGTATGTTTG
jgi:NADH dehydrogenase FAD-containing subunit